MIPNFILFVPSIVQNSYNRRDLFEQKFTREPSRFLDSFERKKKREMD